MGTSLPASGPYHTLSVLVENKAGVLTRIASLFALPRFQYLASLRWPH